jgi:NTE family protein
MPTPLQVRGQKIVDALRGIVRDTSSRDGTVPDPKIGIAFGGGSARGLIHIAYIAAMDDLGITPAVVSGTSIGALIGSGWAAGLSGADLREFSEDALGTMRTIAGRLWATHMGGGIKDLFRSGIPTQLDGAKVVESFTPHPFPQDFKDLKVPFYVVATDYQSWHQVVFNSGPLIPAIAGSIAIPTLFRPVVHANHILVDGSVVNPLPLDQASTGTDLTIAIDVNGDPSEGLSKTDHKALDMWFGSAQIMMHSLIAHMMAAYPPDIYVRPHLGKFGAMEFWRVKEIIAHAADEERERFKRIVSDRIESFIADQQRTIATVRPTGLRSAQK